MTDIGPTGYMSDGDIIAWLQEKSNDQYTGLRNQMNASSERGDVIKGLADLGSAAQANQSANVNFDNTQKFLTDHAGSPEAQQYDEKLLNYQITILPATADPTGNGAMISASIDASSLSDAQKQDLHASLSQALSPDDNRQTNASKADTYTAFGQDMKNLTDDLGRIDQLGLIQIQQLVSDAKQTDQLASNILSSRDQASNAVVGNLRG